MEKLYIFTITYNFDGDSIAKRCNSYEEAINMLNTYLNDEIKVINDECEYNPSVLEWSEGDVTLVYAEGYDTKTTDRNYATEDCAFYRIFEV